MLSFKGLSRSKNLFIPLFGYLIAAALASKIAGIFLPEELALHDYAISSVLDLTLIVGAYFLTVSRLENRPVKELLFDFKSVFYAFSMATIILGLSTALLFFVDAYQVVELRSWDLLPYVVVALFFQGIAAEVLFRGIFYRNMASWLGHGIAVPLMCTVYASLNLLIDGLYVQVFIGHWLFNCLLCLIYIKTPNLWVTGALHGTWLVISFLPGVLDEHWREGAVILTKVDGDIWLTGGQWGAELSIFCIVILSTVSVYLYMNQRATSPDLNRA